MTETRPPTRREEETPRIRSIELLRKTVAMLCNFAWTKKLRPGEHLWSIPADKERDFDMILNDAIDELEQRRMREAASLLRDELPQGERELLHAIIADCNGLIDPEAHPELNARIEAVLLPCDASACELRELNARLEVQRGARSPVTPTPEEDGKDLGANGQTYTDPPGRATASENGR